MVSGIDSQVNKRLAALKAELARFENDGPPSYPPSDVDSLASCEAEVVETDPECSG